MISIEKARAVDRIVRSVLGVGSGPLGWVAKDAGTVGGWTAGTAPSLGDNRGYYLSNTLVISNDNVRQSRGLQW